MIETITFNGKNYPALQAHGFASQYAFEFAKKFCKGNGIDIGYSKPEWKFSDAEGLDHLKFLYRDGSENNESCFTAGDFYAKDLDYIFSSHCLEHLDDYVGHLDYWSGKLRIGGVLFLYLPNMDYQEYWNCANNRKHVCYISPKVIQSYFDNRKEMWKDVFVTEGYDLNGSFYAIASKI